MSECPYIVRGKEGTAYCRLAENTAEQVKPLVEALREAKIFLQRHLDEYAFTAEYETLLLDIDRALKQFGDV